MISMKVKLREVEENDVKEIVKWKTDPYVRRMSTGLKSEITIENQLKDIKRALRSSDEEYYIICTTEAIGYIRVNWMDAEHSMAWLRFGLGKSRGQGLAYDALSYFINALKTREVHRIEAEVYDYNTISYNLLKKLGFEEEGRKRKAHYEEDEYHDVYVMGYLNE